MADNIPLAHGCDRVACLCPDRRAHHARGGVRSAGRATVCAVVNRLRTMPLVVSGGISLIDPLRRLPGHCGRVTRPNVIGLFLIIETREILSTHLPDGQRSKWFPMFLRPTAPMIYPFESRSDRANGSSKTLSKAAIFYRTDTLVSRLTIKVKAAKGIFTTVVTESAKAISEPRKAPRYRPALPVFHAEYGGQHPRRAQSARW
jgi:hypothetical protein